ncbi:MAG: type II toxin-antitoxin system PemK/MazF family toxin [Candidatus Nanopelagicales bacterium]
MVMPLESGAVVWAELGPSAGREQGGRRPVVVISSPDHLDLVDSLVTVIPCTSRDRGWPNHVALAGQTGLDRLTLAMTEQVRTIARSRVVERAGTVDDRCLAAITTWLRDWLA